MYIIFMYFYIRNITNLKKGEVLPPFSKTPPEKVYMKVLRTTKYEVRKTMKKNEMLNNVKI